MPDAALPHHKLSIRRQLGSLRLDADLRLSAPWTLLFGPSGSGKSSILRAACGLLPAQGVGFTRTQADAADLTLTDAPIHLRNLAWAPQHASLFPHLDVSQNISFSYRVAPGKGNQMSLGGVIDLFRLEPLLKRRPSDLSGGERQRVNLARAFATPACRLMLLDEPFAGLDNASRDQLLPAMRTFLAARGIPVLSVSHNVEEAIQLDADVILLRDGHVEAQGPAATVLAPERERLLRSLA